MLSGTLKGYSYSAPPLALVKLKKKNDLLKSILLNSRRKKQMLKENKTGKLQNFDSILENNVVFKIVK